MRSSPLRKDSAIETMEGQASSALGEVDTTRPFRSVKEAVAVFGERFLAGDAPPPQKAHADAEPDITPRPTCSLPAPKPAYSASSSPLSYTSSASHFIRCKDDEITVFTCLRNLEAELEEMKRELRLLKERESETARAIATINSQLHKNMSRLAEIEAAESAVSMEQRTKARSERWQDDRPRDMEERLEYLPCLGQALSLAEIEEHLGGRRKIKLRKRKPIIPLLGHLLSRKRESSDLNSSVYSRSSFYSFS
ncbi:hypothetical protein MUK42_06699 [Musa troglodytarum]|uniref:WEB family protein n=1 Tax=Musa troglodytarum TaxID=320322 RepID=A0A9E7HE18_9LILI|nr:hypothetical protein MUK42_06699 [Musa troglodytarum]